MVMTLMTTVLPKTHVSVPLDLLENADKSGFLVAVILMKEMIVILTLKSKHQQSVNSIHLKERRLVLVHWASCSQATK